MNWRYFSCRGWLGINRRKQSLAPSSPANTTQFSSRGESPALAVNFPQAPGTRLKLRARQANRRALPPAPKRKLRSAIELRPRRAKPPATAARKSHAGAGLRVPGATQQCLCKRPEEGATPNQTTSTANRARQQSSSLSAAEYRRPGPHLFLEMPCPVAPERWPDLPAPAPASPLASTARWRCTTLIPCSVSTVHRVVPGSRDQRPGRGTERKQA